LGTVDP